MIDQAAAAYEQNPLMQKIRSEYGSRKVSEGASDVGAPLQDELRSSERESGSTGSTDIERRTRGEGDASRSEANERTSKGSDSGERRSNSTAHESDGGSNSGHNRLSRAFQFKQTDSGGLDEEKPVGLAAKPHAKERRAREEQARAEAAASPSGETTGKKNFFSWLRSDNRGKTAARKEPKSKRRPLTEKEVEELKPDLVEALKVSLPLLDEVIYATNKAHKKPYIYASLDDEDIDKLANFWLRRARKSGEVAAVATQFVEYRNDVEILTMMLPTFGQTFMFYKENGGLTLRGR